MTLVFGCRQSKIDHIYREETTLAKNKGVLKDLYTAYSREPDKPKVTAGGAPDRVFFQLVEPTGARSDFYRAGPGQASLLCTPSHPPVPVLQKYVQDILQEQLAGSVYKALKEQSGHVYVCGDVTMAGDVLKTIQSIARHQGRLTAEEASTFVSKLRVSRRGPPSPWLVVSMASVCVCVCVT